MPKHSHNTQINSGELMLSEELTNALFYRIYYNNQ